MGIIKPSNTSVENFKGLHLYHAGFSNCAMRVRLTLAEKQLHWTSHLLDLLKGENYSKDYIGVNPNGLVPSLIDNGTVIIESADIIDYLDMNYSAYSLRPTNEQDLLDMYYWMNLASDNHFSIKTFMYTNAKGGKQLMRSPEQMAQYRENQTFNKALLAFHERYNSNEGFTQIDIDKATNVLNDCFTRINTRLKQHKFLAGEAFSLADIAWIPQLVILKIADYPFHQFTHLENWKNEIINRPSFKTAILDWLPQK
ncbi:glutathione S-transferase family protein [Alginatibacterium sediminis]|uniref:Glutathione S-transferase family protein n=1 Tax=Alginatibacterium sediminis TaxID=2164068 RepID=A0A420EH43_9ALTE|nr:glutathione S-transferase family protein [Alginatibacterium sediminis]RKF19876.1 glutathione S-transferase family protein [Alginatibacterium sediminis]